MAKNEKLKTQKPVMCYGCTELSEQSIEARQFSKYFCSVLGKKADTKFTSWDV